MSTDRDQNRGSRRDGKGKSTSRKRNSPGRGRARSSDETSGNRPFDKRPGRKKYDNDSSDRRERPSEGNSPRSRKPFDKKERPFSRNPEAEGKDDKAFEKKSRSARFKSDETKKSSDGERNFATSRENYDKQHGRRKFERTEDTPAYKSKYKTDRGRNKPYKGKRGGEVLPTEAKERDNRIRLNKYIANSGLCNRREADEFIASGMVEVNGKTITEMGFKVNPGDEVKYAGERLSPGKSIYVLMNKPKDFVTTMKAYKGSHTVKQLMRDLNGTNVLPVGKLDRGTTGLIMFTNDGDLAKKLTHPKHNVKKLYHVSLDKSVKEEHLIQLVEGVELASGTMAADVVSYVGDGKDKREVGVEIHGGKNRVLTQLFEGLGYKVMKLDRVVFAGLTKKDLPRGNWRYLTEQEVNNLKMLK